MISLRIDRSGPLGYAPFRRALVGSTVSGAGSWMQTVAAGWLVYDLTGSAAAVGVLTVLSRGSGMALSFHGGALADRFDRRRLVIILYAIQIAPAALLALVAWEGISRVTEVYVATLLIGTADALASPALKQLVTATVPPELARRAAGLGSASYNLARLIGPAVGGGLVVGVGPGPCFALNAASYLAVVFAVASLPASTGVAPHRRNRLRVALSTARLDPLLRGLVIGTVLFAVFVAPVQELAPAIARRHGDGAHLLGFLLSGLAVGGLLGNPLIARLDRRGITALTIARWATVVSALTLLVLAVTSSYLGVLAAMIVCGAAWEVRFIVSLTGMQFADTRMSGVMVGLFYTGMLGGVTLGTLLVGSLFDIVGIGWGLTVCAIAAAAGAVVAVRAPAHRLVPEPERPTTSHAH